MITRIGDGNSIRPPRNLVDLVLKAREAQLRQEDRGARTYAIGEPLISSEAIKSGQEALSQERVEDTLLAESGEYATLIDNFRNGKAGHDIDTLGEILGTNVKTKIDFLRSIGFLGPPSVNYKIPMLYRRGLGITQGKAFPSATDVADDDDG